MRIKHFGSLLGLLVSVGTGQALAADSATCQALALRYQNLIPTSSHSVSWGPCPGFRLRGLARAERLLQVYANAHDLPEVPPGLNADLIQDLALAANHLAASEPEVSPGIMAAQAEQIFADDRGQSFRERQLEWALAHQMLKLRLALQAKDPTAALAPVQALLDHLDAFEITRRPSWPEDPVQTLQRIQDILSGKVQAATTLPVVAPSQPWFFHNDHVVECQGWIRVQSVPLELELPTEFEAWIAVGEADTALASYLHSTWLSHAERVDLPRSLRALAGSAFGTAEAERQFEAAVDSIQIHKTAFGSTASIRLFGQTLPLPVGEYDETFSESMSHDEGPVHQLDATRLSNWSLADLQKGLHESWDRQREETAIADFDRLVQRCQPPVKAEPRHFDRNEDSTPESDPSDGLTVIVVNAWEIAGCPRLLHPGLQTD